MSDEMNSQDKKETINFMPSDSGTLHRIAATKNAVVVQIFDELLDDEGNYKTTTHIECKDMGKKDALSALAKKIVACLNSAPSDAVGGGYCICDGIDMRHCPYHKLEISCSANQDVDNQIGSMGDAEAVTLGCENERNKVSKAPSPTIPLTPYGEALSKANPLCEASFHEGYQAASAETKQLKHDRDMAEKNHARIAAENLQLRDEIAKRDALFKAAKAGLEKGRSLSSWVGTINWRGGENLQPWLDDLSQKMTEFDAARGEFLNQFKEAGY